MYMGDRHIWFIRNFITYQESHFTDLDILNNPGEQTDENRLPVRLSMIYIHCVFCLSHPANELWITLIEWKRTFIYFPCNCSLLIFFFVVEKKTFCLVRNIKKIFKVSMCSKMGFKCRSKFVIFRWWTNMIKCMVRFS